MMAIKDSEVVTVGILKGMFDQFSGAIGERFDKVDKRLDGMDKRMDDGFDMLNDKIDRVEACLDLNIKVEASKLYRRIDQVDRSSKRRDEEILKRISGSGLTKSEWLDDEGDADEDLGEPVQA